MIEFMDESTGKFVAIKASGKLTDTDYKDVLLPNLKTLFKANEKLDLLFYMDKSFEGWDFHAAWDDMSFGLGNAADFEKLALVGGPKWVEWCIKACGFLFKGEVRVFAEKDLEHAWEWIAG